MIPSRKPLEQRLRAAGPRRVDRRRSAAAALRIGLAAWLALGLATAAMGAVRGTVVVDLASETVLSASAPGQPVAPASLAKVMTLYLLLSAVEAGELAMDQFLPVSAAAAAQPATRLGLREGERITVRRAAEALLVRSANDVAVVIAEALAGSEAAFTRRMNAAAAALGLHGTRFANASGLPGAQARTTARDMALLTVRLYLHFAAHGDLFALTETRHGGRRIVTHNGMLTGYAGAIGLKTGFTCRAGYNTIVVARRGARTLLAVVLGAPSSAVRNVTATRLLDAAFAASSAGPVAGPSLTELAPAATGQLRAVLGASCGGSGPGPAHPHYRASGWSVELDLFASSAAALRLARQVQSGVSGARPLLVPLGGGSNAHRAGLTGLTRTTAVATCRRLRAAGRFCLVRTPASVAEYARRARLLAAPPR